MNTSTSANLELYELYKAYGEKSSPSVLIPKTVPGQSGPAVKNEIKNLIPTVQKVRDLAQGAGLSVTIRNCARYRGFVRVHFRPANQFYRMLAEGEAEYDDQAAEHSGTA